jgi:hypothetical protein
MYRFCIETNRYAFFGFAPVYWVDISRLTKR